MKSKKKIVLTVICALLLVFGSVMATMAYLTSNDEVTNTFTVGSVTITMDETDVDEDGKKDGDTRVKENTYKLMPGHEYIKDPIVHVAATSQPAWIFVEVTNEIAGIEDADSTIAAQLAANGWTLVAGENNVYAYKETVNGGTDVPVFSKFKVAGTVTDLTSYEGKQISVKAYAVQADGFATSAAAWAASGF